MCKAALKSSGSSFDLVSNGQCSVKTKLTEHPNLFHSWEANSWCCVALVFMKGNMRREVKQTKKNHMNSIVTILTMLKQPEIRYDESDLEPEIQVVQIWYVKIWFSSFTLVEKKIRSESLVGTQNKLCI